MIINVAAGSSSKARRARGTLERLVGHSRNRQVTTRKLDTLRSPRHEGCYCAKAPRPSKLNLAGSRPSRPFGRSSR